MENGNLYTVSGTTRRVSCEANFTSKEHSNTSWEGTYVRRCALSLLLLKRFIFVTLFFKLTVVFIVDSYSFINLFSYDRIW